MAFMDYKRDVSRMEDVTTDEKIMTSVDVIATFNSLGKFRPIYVRVEDDDGLLRSYSILNVLYEKDLLYCGLRRTLFRVHLDCSGIAVQYELIYDKISCKWTISKA